MYDIYVYYVKKRVKIFNISLNYDKIVQNVLIGF